MVALKCYYNEHYHNLIFSYVYYFNGNLTSIFDKFVI